MKHLLLAAGTAAEVRLRGGGGGSNATAGEAEETWAPRARSEASKILGELSEIWDTWLPPKAVDSFRRGESRGGGRPRFGRRERDRRGRVGPLPLLHREGRK